jgi:hypothetical protein
MHGTASRVAVLLAYALSCALLHGLLQQHYTAACGTWFSMFYAESSPYCAFLRGGLKALQVAPVLAFGTVHALRAG